MGGIRYGLLREEGKPQYGRVESMIKRLRLYEKDKNAEHLVDVANIAALEFTEGDNSFHSVDDGEHTDAK